MAEAIYDGFVRVTLIAGSLDENILIERMGNSGIFNIEDIRKRNGTPRYADLIGFEFDDKEASLIFFPETNKYETDGFLEEDEYKVNATMKEILKIGRGALKKRSSQRRINSERSVE